MAILCLRSPQYSFTEIRDNQFQVERCDSETDSDIASLIHNYEVGDTW